MLRRCSAFHVAAFIILIVESNAAEPTIHYVDADAHGDATGRGWVDAYSEISQALGQAKPGDQVWVAEGKYYERLTMPPGVAMYGGFSGREGAVDQRNWKANRTSVDAGFSQSTIVVAASTQGSARIDGFVIENGRSDRGGGVLVEGAIITIANNTITGNCATVGGGIYIGMDSDAMIEENTIESNCAVQGGGLHVMESRANVVRNSISSNWAGDGGGVYAVHSRVTVDGNLMVANLAHNGGAAMLFGSRAVRENMIAKNYATYRGGGFYLALDHGLVQRNQFIGNSSGRFGGGMALQKSSAMIESNLFIGNQSERGGGIVSSAYAAGNLVGNSIVGNQAVEGGGVYLEYFAWPAIIANVVAFNSSGIAKDETIGATTVQYNCLFANGESDYSWTPDPTGMNGNLAADPQFERLPDAGLDGVWGTADDDAGDLRLRHGSPAINAGELDPDWGRGSADFDGHARILCGRVDMGAYESGFGDFDCDGRVNVNDFDWWDACATDPKRIAFGAFVANENYDEGGVEREAPWPAAGSCAPLDSDGDIDVDLKDFAVFQGVFSSGK